MDRNKSKQSDSQDECLPEPKFFLPQHGVSPTHPTLSDESLNTYRQLLLDENQRDKYSLYMNSFPKGLLPVPKHIRFDDDDMQHFAARAFQLQSLLQGLRDGGAVAGSLCAMSFDLIRSGTELKRRELDECLGLVELTSGYHYQASSIGWNTRQKKLEMLDKEMIYLLVRQGDVDEEAEQGKQDSKHKKDPATTEQAKSEPNALEQLAMGYASDSEEELQDKTSTAALEKSPPATSSSISKSGGPDPSKILGFMSFMFTHDDPPHENRQVVYIYEIHLHKRLRGQGLGSKLIKFAEDAATQCGVSKTMLTVFTINKKAVALYEKLGYHKDACSPEPRVTRRKVIPADYVIMSKELA